MIDWDNMGLELTAECSNGTEVIEAVNNSRGNIDILLSDVMMPGMNGLELSAYMHDNYPSCDVIFFSAYSEYTLLREAIRSHASDYLLKPISRSLLNQTLEAVVLKQRNYMPDLDIGKSRPDKIAVDVIKYIDKNWNRPISLWQIADALGYNGSYISRVFKQYTGSSLIQYLNRIRIEQAQKILDKNDKYRVAELAEAVGISDVDYFCRMFKKYSGKTPSQYKAKRDGTNV